MTPAELSDRIGRLRPCWRDPSRFLAERSELARAASMIAVPRTATVMRVETADPRGDERVKRLSALVRAKETENRTLREALAEKQRRRRRSRADDERQMRLL